MFFLIKKILDKNEWKNSNDKPIIVITGDIVDDGRKSQFKKAQEILIDPLKKANFKVISIPGNHDYGWIGNFAQKKKFKYFKRYLIGLRRVSYPDLIEFDNGKLVIICLNSMKSETGFYDGLLADGELGGKQLNELDEILDYLDGMADNMKPAVAICLHHHPFIFPGMNDLKEAGERIAHQLKDGDELMELIGNRVDVLLFGHDHHHIDFSKERKGRILTDEYKIPVILSSGKSTDSGHPARLITINGPGVLEVEDIAL
jgi:3',5'-cyclic AMP phosphodiesterase CpdA